MEHEKPFQKKSFLLEPAYRSSLNFRASDLTNMKSAIYDVDMEAQDDDDAAVTKHRSESQRKLLAEGAVAREGRRRFWITCCCHMVFLTLILLLIAGILVVKLVPKDPRVSLGDLRLTEFTYNSSSPTPGRPQLQAGFTGELNLTNRNRIAEESYREISLDFSFGDSILGQFSLPGFHQKEKRTASLALDFKNRSTVIENQVDAGRLKTQVGGSNVQIQMTGRVKGRHKVFGMRVKKFDIDVRCVINVRPGSQSSKPQQLGNSCYHDD